MTMIQVYSVGFIVTVVMAILFLDIANDISKHKEDRSTTISNAFVIAFMWPILLIGVGLDLVIRLGRWIFSKPPSDGMWF